ncbi:DENN domain and WD repeat-containing protein SCD1 isoform X2 [Selaginella moellendorffii]|uniref:DENN domain and WD repeat-containing protein SCD1 isoform X2 n=1 Tax=Selaginella moellendorffii TaxID=88036 RepID=UPI000D1CD89D|nr:DENN domain and WD repeat-containing protein SCD1 isoform X2 [Selaginella moellendorffii]|eukprot:XP_024518570.1 DENN domain and WD repeat-containing protein SCD1 isoform X2 [Selaginella moellendorffii]
MAKLVEYFLVCGLGPEVQASNGARGYHGSTGVSYSPSLLDQFPPASTDRPPPPPQLPMCVLPGGVAFHSTGFIITDESSYPRSYPIILTDGDGSKIYVSCVAFRDPVDEDIAEAYRIPANSYVDKCICLVSHSPCFRLFAEALEELHRLCFSPSGSSKPLWDIVAHMVTSVPLPTPGQSQVLFSLESRLLCIDMPPKGGFPHADMSFQPLLQCLDVDNVLQLFVSILLERRVLLRANKLSLLTMVAEAVCHLIYPIKWQHVYIPVLFYAGVDYIEAPTPYLMGLHSAVDISNFSLDGVVVVDLENNQIFSSEAIPPLTEPEGSILRRDLVRLLYPNVVHLDRARKTIGDPCYDDLRLGNKKWNEKHDLELRLIFLQFFASVLPDYRKFVGSAHVAMNVFNTQAFLKKRARALGRQPDPMIFQLLNSQGFMDFLDRGYGAPDAGLNLVDKLQSVIANSESRGAILPLPYDEPEIITVADIQSKGPAARSRFCYDRFPANVRTQFEEEKRSAILAKANASFDRPNRPAVSSPVSGSFSPRERAAERDRMVLDIKVKLQGLWLRLLNLSSVEDPFSSFEYGTILALIESDAEGIGGSGFVECVREHIHSGWQCRVSEEQFVAVKELVKTIVNRATSRNDMETVRDALEISAEVHRRDAGNILDFVQRHLGSLPVWDDIRFWEGYCEYIMERSSDRTGKYADLVTEQLVVIARHLAGLKVPDPEAWLILESLALKNNLGSKQLIKLRGILAHVQNVKQGYWGKLPTSRAQPVASYPQDRQENDDSQSSQAAGAGRSWMQSMFSRDRASFRQPANDGRGRTDAPVSGSRQNQRANVDSTQAVKRSPALRNLRGHTGPVTALHVGTRSEMGDLVGENEPGMFISGSADCTLKIWDPTVRGSEFRATLEGHTATIRAISSDKLRIVSGGDDTLVLIWDKATSQNSMKLDGHREKISCVRMLSEERVLSASHDGTVKMWDARTDACVANVGQSSSAILCMDYDDTTRILAAAGMDGVVKVWDVRAGKQVHMLLGHKKWIRTLRMVKDTIVTGSDDWTARVWSVSQGSCDAVLACHAGGITCVEYSATDDGIITGSADGLVRIWEYQNGGLLQCVKNVGVHVSPILSVKAGPRWLAIGAGDNSMSLFHKAEQNDQAKGMAGWQLYRTPQRSAAVVRCVACDADRGRICSGGRNGLLRLWEPNL